MRNETGDLVGRLRHASRSMVRDLGLLGGGRGEDAAPGLPITTCHALIELGAHPNRTVGELAAALRIDKSNASRTAATLIRDGLVETAPALDRRRRCLSLTPTGRQQLQCLHDRVDRQVAAALEHLDPAERQAAARGVALYAKALGRLRRVGDVQIGLVRAADDAALLQIIADASSEFGFGACFTAAVRAPSSEFAAPRAAYFVARRADRVVGGAGFVPRATDGASDAAVCELRQMYLARDARGGGLGRRLLHTCLAAARDLGYRTCYLETHDAMTAAHGLYERCGFRRACPRGDGSAGRGCDTYYELDLQAGATGPTG
ncbi:MAG: helix-turn-helix domain-containing GNAT family N-acetyltransferase [Planctomycetota bacterium]